MIDELGIDDLCDLLEEVDSESCSSESDSSECGRTNVNASETNEKKAAKRTRDHDANENARRKYVTVVAKQVAIKNGYLLKFPVGLANCLNGANFSGLTQMMDSYLFHDCRVNLGFSKEANFSCAGGNDLVNFFSLVNSFYPDRIMVVHTAVVEDNKLNASFYYKFTDNKFLYDAVARKPINPKFLPLFPPKRSDSLKRKMRLDGHSMAVLQQTKAWIESEDELVVYGSFHMQMIIQEVTEKIIGLNIVGNFSSAHPAAFDGSIPDIDFEKEAQEQTKTTPGTTNL